MPKRSIQQKSDNVHVVNIEMDGRSDNQRFLLISDLHLDSKYCDRSLLKKHLDQAKEQGAGVYMFGDIFDAMQGMNDRRRSRRSLVARDLAGPYFDGLVKDAAEFFKPYIGCIDMISYGNHETSVERYNDTDLIERLQYHLNAERQDGESRVEKGQYAGWVVFRVNRSGSTMGKVTLGYHHGYGGGAVVTKGAIQQYRQSAIYDADIYVMGHNHQKQTTEMVKVGLNAYDNLVKKRQLHLRTATYKDEFGQGEQGWGVEKGFGPTPMGGYWIDIYPDGDTVSFNYTPTS